MGNPEIVAARCQDESGKKNNPCPEEEAGHEENNEYRPESEEGRGNPRSFFGVAEGSESKSQNPIIERRVFKEGLLIQGGNGPVPRKRHFPANLGDPRFIPADHSPRFERPMEKKCCISLAC